MPLMAGLTREITAALEDERLADEFRNIAFIDSNFELAVSYLSEGQPWLDESDRLRNRALFLDLSDAIQKVIVTAQNEAIKRSDNCPPWLLHLVLWMQRNRASIITLNYDTLL
jgi:hypothetical protein